MATDDKRNKSIVAIMVIFIASIIFLTQAFRFINSEGNTHPIVSSLFNMTLLIGLIILIIHKKEFEEGKNTLLKQTTLDKYFNLIK